MQESIRFGKVAVVSSPSPRNEFAITLPLYLKLSVRSPQVFGKFQQQLRAFCGAQDCCPSELQHLQNEKHGKKSIYYDPYMSAVLLERYQLNYESSSSGRG
jgi:hypothetical protein